MCGITFKQIIHLLGSVVIIFPQPAFKSPGRCYRRIAMALPVKGSPPERVGEKEIVE